MTRRATRWALALACLLAAVEARAAAVTPLPERLSDDVVLRDQARFDSLAMRLAAFDTVSAPRSVYAHAKAKAWLELARQTYVLNDRTGLCETAYDQARTLTSALETRSENAQAPPRIIPGSSRVREDLWQLSDSLKRTDAMRCVAADLGRLEVMLVRAGHETLLCHPWEPHPYAADAGRLAPEIRRRADECVMPIAAAPPPPVPVPAPETPPAEIKAALRRLGALNNVHFDRKADTLSVITRGVLDSVIAVMKAVPEIQATLIGHTDPRGSVAYNLELGRRRSRAVYFYLIEGGVESPRLTFGTEGKAAPVAIGSGVREYALNRRVEIKYSAPGNVQIDARHQERDLQIEKKRPAKPASNAPKKPKPRTTPH